jgi:23S rRNA (uracil1939-C5)-methyltransferase
VEVLKPAENRIVPKCEVFGVCGGCSFQHLSSEDQIEAKGEWLKDAFKQQANIEPNAHQWKHATPHTYPY